jgi:hypothetical protein
LALRYTGAIGPSGSRPADQATASRPAHIADYARAAKGLVRIVRARYARRLPQLQEEYRRAAMWALPPRPPAIHHLFTAAIRNG